MLIIPCIYGLPKIHKYGVPLHPIVNTIGYPTYKLERFLANLLKPLVGKTSSFVKDSASWINEIGNKNINIDDILVSFDVVSLYTKILVSDAIETIRSLTNDDTGKLVEVCLRSTFFTFRKVFYEQVEGVAMGSPLSPIIANIYMESFEKAVIDSFPLKPKRWKLCVDNTDVVWPHGKEELDRFLGHLNNQNDNIRFTMEIKNNMSLPFLDVLISKNDDGSISHQVYRKKTHTNRYLHAKSHHYPPKKMVSLIPWL